MLSYVRRPNRHSTTGRRHATLAPWLGQVGVGALLLTALPGKLTLSVLEAQTFVQLTDLGSSIGPRLTRTVAKQRVNRFLFGRIGTKVSFINFGTVYQFAGDPDWSRILVGLKDQWIHEYRNDAGPGGRIVSPGGIDISARKNFYTADRPKARVFAAVFDPSVKNLVNPKTWSGPFLRPVDVAWDGRTSPTTLDFLYVLDDSASSVTYWDVNLAVPGTLAWSYGSRGSAAGQFLRPSGICVGKTAGLNGGTQFTTYFYVVDRGNGRVVWLNRGSNGPSWLNLVSLPNWDPTDCAVDHFGNLYVVDQSNHRVHKFTYSLTLLATYGAYGKGSTNYNTFAWPHAISVPCGLKTVNSQTVWYCEGRVITAEQWSDASGAVEHYLCVATSVVAGPTVVDPGRTYNFTYKATDHAYHSWWIVNQAGMQVTSTWSGGLRPPDSHTEWWYGIASDGSVAPAGNYQFVVRAQSAYGGCQQQLWSASFYHAGPPPPPPPPPDCNPNCELQTESDQAVPTTLFMRQRVLVAPRPLARIVGPAEGSSESAASPSGSLTEAVRHYGVRGVSFGVTRAAAASPVLIRVYSLSGRLIRVLINQRLDAGFYEVGWDGNDDRGRPAAPGVYTTVMTAGSFRATQRLILRQR